MRQIYKAKNTGNRVLLHVVSENVSSPTGAEQGGCCEKYQPTNQPALSMHTKYPTQLKRKKEKSKNRKQVKARKSNSRSWAVTEKGVGHIEAIKCIKGTERRTQQGEEVRVALR